jgi:ubiquinone/menaquinone biosynthesis C-methylase UbiE
MSPNMSVYDPEQENVNLRAAWDCYPDEHLAVYLSIEEQDQRINTQSILTRALLIDSLWPGRFSAWIDEELRFGVVMTWMLQALRAGADRWALLNDLSAPPRDDRIPRIVRDTLAELQFPRCPIPDLISDALLFRNPDGPDFYLFEPPLNTFVNCWQTLLADLPSEPVNVLEIACGSGNDYAAIQEIGLSAHIAYSGFDICGKNIRNARARFPGVNFFEASILNSGLSDNGVDYLFVHDLIGHLSPEGMEVALREIMRLARKEAWIHCYNVIDADRHDVRPLSPYYRTRISATQLTASLERAGADVEAVSISALLDRKFGHVPEYSRTACTFIARKRA